VFLSQIDRLRIKIYDNSLFISAIHNYEENRLYNTGYNSYTFEDKPKNLGSKRMLVDGTMLVGWAIDHSSSVP
jgi:hypothetical protein